MLALRCLRAFRLVLLAAGLLLVLAACERQPQKLPPLDPSLQAASQAQKQMDFNVREYIRQRGRVNRLAWPILTANQPLCRNTAPRLGLWAASLEDLPSRVRNSFADVFGTDQRLMAMDVFPGGPAEKAGVQMGDIILSVNGDKAPEGFDAADRFTRLLAKHMVKSQTMTFALERKRQPLTVQVTAEKACNPNVFLLHNPTPNAFANGVNIYIYDGLLRFLDSDEDIASVIAHELAHNEMGHIEAKIANYQTAAGVGQLIGTITGVDLSGQLGRMAAQSYSQEFEHEADYVGIYYLARAGYDIVFVPDTERKFATLDPKHIAKGTSHPPSAERFVAIEAAVKEVQGKLASGQKLLDLRPEMKPKQ